MYFLAVRGTVTTASRGNPEKIEINNQDPDILADVVNEFIKKYNIELDKNERAGWFLFSDWN